MAAARSHTATPVNFYTVIGKKYTTAQKQYPNFDRYHISIPSRILICGKTGSGKTSTLMNIVFGMACWTRVVLIAKNLEEPLYAWMIDEFRKIEARLGIQMLTVSTTLDDLPDESEFDKKQTNLVIIDDQINEKDKALAKVASFWTQGRKRSITSVFITQSYFKCPPTLRKNSDYFIFKNMLKRDLKLILSEFTMDHSVDDLMKMYLKCKTTQVDSFFMIDTLSQGTEWEFRHNFEPIDECN